MPRMVKAILIDPFTQEVKEVEHDADDYRNIHRLLSTESNKVHSFDVVRIDDTNAIFLDDNGLYVENQAYVLWDGYHQPLAGKCLILGCDEEGETIGTTLTESEVSAKVRMTDRIRCVDFEDFEGVEDHPIFGKMTVIGHRPIFESK